MGDKRYRVGGTRGGQDQFKWEDVKGDAHRENYLGHSLLAPVGRWQRGKDLKWWNKKGESADAARAQAEMEKARLKQLDEDLLNEALGLQPRANRAQQSELSAADRRKLLEKGGDADPDDMDAERVSGLGAGPAKHHEHIPSLTLKERELERLRRERERKEGGLTEASLVEIVDYEKEQQEKAAAVATAASAARGTGAGVSRKRSREEKKARKREKKERKRARKHKKKEKKLKKAIELADREPPKGGVGENDRHPRRQEESGNTESRTNGSTRHEESSRGALARGMEDGDRGRAGSRERDYRNGAVGGNSGRGRDRENWEEGRQSADWNRQKVRQLQRHSAIRHRSKSPPAYEYRQHSTLRIEGGRKVKGSRDRHPREYGSPRNLEGPRETNTCDQLGGDDGKPGVARIKRSPSASSSSTGSSSSSSGSSQSGNSDENRNRNRDTRGKQDKPPNGRGGTHERSRSRDGVRSSHNRYTRSRSRSPEWRMGNHSRKKSYGTNRLENRRRGSDMGKERDDRDWRR